MNRIFSASGRETVKSVKINNNRGSYWQDCFFSFVDIYYFLNLDISKIMVLSRIYPVHYLQSTCSIREIRLKIGPCYLRGTLLSDK
jgi:hypothetical protein